MVYWCIGYLRLGRVIGSATLSVIGGLRPWDWLADHVLLLQEGRHAGLPLRSIRYTNPINKKHCAAMHTKTLHSPLSTLHSHKAMHPEIPHS